MVPHCEVSRVSCGSGQGGLRGSGEAQSTPGGEGSPSGSRSPWYTWLPESGGFAPAPLLGACQLMRSGLSPTPTPTSGYMANLDLSWRWLQPQSATSCKRSAVMRVCTTQQADHSNQATPVIPHACSSQPQQAYHPHRAEPPASSGWVLLVVADCDRQKAVAA